jgi:Na+/proline symporter
MTMNAGGNTYGNWFALTLLSMLAVMFLPRQFQVAVVENVNENHLRRAIWLFPLYLLLINIFVLPIALGGLMHFAGQDVDADTFVLTLPMAQGHGWLALLVFIGGLSAATGMVIVETIALSTMVCNDLVMPCCCVIAGSRCRAGRICRACCWASGAVQSSSSCFSATCTSGWRARPMRWSASA